MSNRIERNASTRTFGPEQEVSPQRTKTQKKAVGPTLQVDSMQAERPTMSRTATPLPADNMQDAVALYETGLFADPPKQKMWGIGGSVFTDAHKHLVTMLRGEAVRLHLYSRQTKQKLTATEQKLASAERSLRITQDQLADARSVGHGRSEKIVQLTNELREAQESLAEMDSMLTETRRKRQNRLSGIAPGSSIQLGEYAS